MLHFTSWSHAKVSYRKLWGSTCSHDRVTSAGHTFLQGTIRNLEITRYNCVQTADSRKCRTVIPERREMSETLPSALASCLGVYLLDSGPGRGNAKWIMEISWS